MFRLSCLHQLALLPRGAIPELVMVRERDGEVSNALDWMVRRRKGLD